MTPNDEARRIWHSAVKATSGTLGFAFHEPLVDSLVCIVAQDYAGAAAYLQSAAVLASPDSRRVLESAATRLLALTILLASLLACRQPTSALPAAVEAESICEWRGGSRAIVARPWPSRAVIVCGDGSRWEV